MIKKRKKDAYYLKDLKSASSRFTKCWKFSKS